MNTRAAVLLVSLLVSVGCSGKKQEKPVADAGAQALAAAVEPARTAPTPMIVTDAAGMTVYFHDNDPPMKSRCNGRCAEYWPPVRPPADFVPAGKFSVIQRRDGTPQLAYDGRPLYTFQFDRKPGDRKGDGKQGIWHVMQY